MKLIFRLFKALKFFYEDICLEELNLPTNNKNHTYKFHAYILIIIFLMISKTYNQVSIYVSDIIMYIIGRI